jgi:hypothetical protein
MLRDGLDRINGRYENILNIMNSLGNLVTIAVAGSAVFLCGGALSGAQETPAAKTDSAAPVLERARIPQTPPRVAKGC